MKNAETWVLVLQLSRKDGEINPCNVLVGHGLIRNSADVDAVDGGVNRDVEGLGAGNEFPHEKAKQHLHLVGSPGVVALVRAVGENPQPFADLVHSGWG